MAAQSMDKLRAIIKEALTAYEIARTTRLHRQNLVERDATGEQHRVDTLLTSIQEAEVAARTLLEKSSFAHLMGAPRDWADNPADKRPTEEVVAAAFAEAQLAQVDLRERLLALGIKCLRLPYTPDACTIFEALVEDEKSAVSEEAKIHLVNAYEAIGLVDGHHRPLEVISRIAQGLHNAGTKAAAQAALSRLLVMALRDNRHTLAAYTAIALAPQKAVSLEQRQMLASRPECQIAIRGFSKFTELSSRKLSSHLGYTSGEYVGNYHAALFSNESIGAVIFENCHAIAGQASRCDAFLEIFDLLSGEKIERWDECLDGLSEYGERIESFHRPGTSNESVRSFQFVRNADQFQVILRDGRILVLDRSLRKLKLFAEPVIDPPQNGDVFLTPYLVAAKAKDGAKVLVSADGLYAVVMEENGTLHTLSRVLDLP